jgi:fatty acid desaturase
MLANATLCAHDLTRKSGRSHTSAEQSLVVEQEPQQTIDVEWPTLVVALACWAGFIGLLVWHEHLPAVVVVVGFAVMSGWYMSLQHEVIHGHPTPWRRLNHALVSAPLSLWLPFGLYRELHLVHHRSDLTMPGTDPESFYVSAERWDRASRPHRAALRVNRTFVGRLLVGPALGPPAQVGHELRLAARDPERRHLWLRHLLAATVISWIVFAVADVPVWQYLLGYCYLGMSVTYIRSFVEHLAVAEPATRSAVVRTNWLVGLLFLNNHLHHTHHTLPGAAWYRLPTLTDEIAADEAAAGGAGVYAGYGEVMRRYGLRAFSTPVNPLTERYARQ